MLHFPLYVLATYLVVATSTTAARDEPQAADRASQGDSQPPATSTFGGVRRSGIAQQVTPGSRVGTETRASQARRNGPASAPGVKPSAGQKKAANGSERGRVAIPPPLTSWPAAGARRRTPTADLKLRRVQAQPGGVDMIGSPLPGSAMNIAQPGGPRLADTLVGGQPIAMQAALYGAITGNPDLVTLREGNALAASAEAVETARHFPTTLNPTLWIDYRPITLVPNGTFGTGGQRLRVRKQLLSLRPGLYLRVVAAAGGAGAPNHSSLSHRTGRLRTAKVGGRSS